MKSNKLIPITGRPNAGKTSLVNFLSKTRNPVGKFAGTTTKIFEIPLVRDLFLVDLPGFGRITKRSKEQEENIKHQIIDFLENPLSVIVFPIHIIDASTFPIVVKNLEKKSIIPIDIEMIHFIAEVTEKTPFVVFNKIDKVSTSQLQNNLDILFSYDLPQLIVYKISLKTRFGCSELRRELKRRIIVQLGSKYEQW
ncbi:MAG: GTPase [Candidatus Hodarchaeales archaeon]